MVYHNWNLYQFIVEFYHYYSTQNRKFIFYNFCFTVAVWTAEMICDNLVFHLAILDNVWRKFSASFLALKHVNEWILIHRKSLEQFVCCTWDCRCIKFCVPESYRFSSSLVKSFNQVYPLISALFSWHISQVKIATSNQMPGNFDINVNSVYRLVQKIVFKLAVA